MLLHNENYDEKKNESKKKKETALSKILLNLRLICAIIHIFS